MSTKLSTITTQYRKFNTNQVLTEAQLNEFLDYFEDQDRMSRIGLSGVGIVCGFKVSFDATNKSITLSQGYGVTTDGDLVALQKNIPNEDSILKSIDLKEKVFTHYKPYDNDKVKYLPFFYNNNVQIPLWEVYATAEVDGTDTTFKKLEDLAGLDDMVMLLYLENYAKEGDLCTSLNCDNQGIEQVNRLRVLLVSLEHAKYIASLDAIYQKHDWFPTYDRLPEVAAKRVILTPENTKTFKKLRQNYYKAIRQNHTLTALKMGLSSINSKFQRPDISNEITSLFDFSENAMPLDFQYRYDLFKDLIDTYNEIKDLLLHINVECCPNIGSFPKHLLLGRLVESTDYPLLRHQFYKSPIVDDEDEHYKRVLSLLDRASDLVHRYIESEKPKELKITPSQAHGILGNKAIPFYYNVGGSLLKSWSYEKTLNFKSKFNLSYHRDNLSGALSIQEPLEYNIDQNNFYRIEGHQGMLYRDALGKVLAEKKKYGLGFDVKLLSVDISNRSININDYKCEFEDLQVLLKAWKTEQKCVLAEMTQFFSAFTIDKVGGNVKDVDYLHSATVTSAVSAASGLEGLRATAVTGTPVMTVADVTTVQPVAVYDARNVMTLRKNVVTDNLTIRDNTIGKLVKKAIDENKDGSISDIKVVAANLVGRAVNTTEWNEKPNIKDFIVNDATDLLVTAYVLHEKVPTNLIAIDDTSIATYELTLERVCRLVKQLKSKYQRTELDPIFKNIVGLLINQLSGVCCSGEKLRILLEEIELRKARILEKIQLSKFIDKHPAATHKAGAGPGETFIMVYLADHSQDQSTYDTVTMELNFLEQPNIDDNGLDGDEGRIQLWDDRSSLKFAFLHTVIPETQNKPHEIVLIGGTLAETVRNFAFFLNNRWRIAGVHQKVKAEAVGTKLTISIIDQHVLRDANYILFFNDKIVGTNKKKYFNANEAIATNATLRNTVIADYTLPYMCCSDCSPVNFIIPKEPAFLSLPESFICLDDTIRPRPMPFRISPKDGKITVFVDGVQVSRDIPTGVVKNEEGKPEFDVRETHPSLYGKTLVFKVDEEDTDCKITVYNKPNVSVTTSVTYNEGRTQATLVFNVSGEAIAPSVQFSWDLGIGVQSNNRPDANGNFTYVYELPANDANRIAPSLTLSNGFCTTPVPIEAIQFEDPIDVSLRVRSRICIDITSDAETRVPFSNLSPSDGTISIAGPAIEGVRIEDNELIITSGTFTKFEQEIKFLVNDLPTTAKITVFKKMEISITQDPGGYNWVDGVLHQGYSFVARVPSNTNTAGLSYRWGIGELVRGDEEFLRANLPVAKEGSVYNVILQVRDQNGCTSTATLEINIPYPTFTIATPENVLDYCLDDEQPKVLTVSPVIEGTVITGSGVTTNVTGQHLFVPSGAGLIASGTVPLMIDGVVLLSIRLHEPASPAFTPTQPLPNKIVIKNQSRGEISSYKWFYNDETRVDTEKKDLEIDLTDGVTRTWRLRLEAVTPHCDVRSSRSMIFTAESETPPCIPDTENRIKFDATQLNTLGELPSDLKMEFFDQTVAIYNEVQNAATAYLDGSKNSNLITLFNKLFTTTPDVLKHHAQNEDIRKKLGQIYALQARLFFNVLHCQPHSVLLEHEETIKRLASNLSQGHQRLKEADIKFDVDGAYKMYLTAYSQESGIIGYIVQIITEKLIPFIL